MTKKIPPLVYQTISMGCDPEFFFKVDGETIGAEKILPKNGLSNPNYSNSKFVIDGVQAELNPSPDTCRARLANQISNCFKQLDAELKKQGGNIKADFSRTIEISKENLLALSEDSRKFGCAPSTNAYRSSSGMKIDAVDPTEYRTRAAGGHIHIGHGSSTTWKKAFTKDTKRTVQIFDLIVGNTCVLIDRDPSNIERRKLYGRAGEYRLPNHGLEYRTLSNFWLTSYPLMSLVFALARFATQIAVSPHADIYHKEFMKDIYVKDIKNAINNNDFDIAMVNFEKIRPVWEKIQGEYAGSTPNQESWALTKESIPRFLYFVNKIKEHGLGYWFKEDPMIHWTTLREAHSGGFYDYQRINIADDMRKEQAKAVADAMPLVVTTPTVVAAQMDLPILGMNRVQ